MLKQNPLFPIPTRELGHGLHVVFFSVIHQLRENATYSHLPTGGTANNEQGTISKGCLVGDNPFWTS